MIITIDGPSGTGKSTVAKKVAAILGFAFFDTGAMYRAVAWDLLQKNIPMDDATAIQEVLQNFQYEIHDVAGQKHYIVNGVDVTEVIRTPEVTAQASSIAVLPDVREAMWKIQRHFAQGIDAVFEGRDMGSSVFPQAEAKIFLTARPEIRAERRYQEWAAKQKNSAFSKEQVLRELLERDERDSTRAYAPLLKPRDAKEIDTSDLDIDQVVSTIIDFVHKKKHGS